MLNISTFNPQIKNISFKQNSNFLEERLKKLKELGTKDFDTSYFADNFNKVTKEEQEINITTSKLFFFSFSYKY